MHRNKYVLNKIAKMKLIGYILFLFLNQLLPAQSVKGVLQALAQQDQTFLNQNFASEVH